MWPRALAAGCLLAWLPLAQASAAPATKPAAQPTLESELVSAIEDLRVGKGQSALEKLARLTQQQPNFRLAQLLYADLLAARSGKPGIMPDAEDPALGDLYDEARYRDEQARFTPPPGTVPGNVLKLAAEYPYLVVVDLPNARLNLFENKAGDLKLIHSHYVGIARNGFGKKASGDLRTPVGIYHITGWKSDEQLPELYGSGALPLNYPNLWDRFRVKTGYGIWLHGVPRSTYVRAPRSSEGCVTMANDDLVALKPYVLGTNAPVILSDHLDWMAKAEAAHERDTFLNRIEDWRSKWAARDTEGYLGFYGEDFTTDGMNKAAFVAHKRRVNATKSFIDVKIDDMSLYRYPGEPMMLAEFTLKYRSDNFSSTAKKQQYWRQTAKGDWKIFREENLD
ncbi:L,D-transpeptidase family protein [Hydrocarboniphaga sp.]|uniref:L,D-transpeptidase family protein n=1 Tax=Hydrocarboniphaga sp. TaxID=2033016 RepID=UPI00261EF5C5|nr:L,D-transpeptidase family protein [Hydrocarboniphaga sp.]